MAGDYIFREGDKIDGIYFIQYGKFEVLSTGKNNNSQTVCLVINGHILGYPGCEGEIYPVSAMALSDSTVCYIDNDSFYNVCLHNPQFTMGMIMFYSHEVRKAEIRLKYIVSGN